MVDEGERQPLGRPWLSLAIDVATRMVVGFYLSLQTPSAASVALTISRAVLRKEDYLTALQVEALWPTYGLPRTIQLDNAKEFHARALVRGCEQHGIQIRHRPPLQPHFGGHIERLIGTLMGEIHLLPGTTFSSVAQRGTYDSAAHATMTLAELETWLTWQIVGIYHLRLHATLSCTPLHAWQNGIERMRHPVREPFDLQRFYLDFLPFTKRTVGRAGLRLFNLFYWHGALSRYVQDGNHYLVKYDPRDISRVYLLEKDGSYLEVPYRDLAHGPASLQEIKNAARLLRARGSSLHEEQKLFQTVQRQRELLETARRKTGKARRHAYREPEKKPLPPPAMKSRPLPEAEPEGPVDPFPFEIWRE